MCVFGCINLQAGSEKKELWTPLTTPSSLPNPCFFHYASFHLQVNKLDINLLSNVHNVKAYSCSKWPKVEGRMKNPVSQNIVHMGVMMQNFRQSLWECVCLVLQTKSDWSSLKNEKRERENQILTTVSPLHTWQTAAGSELFRGSSTIWQALTVQSILTTSPLSVGAVEQVPALSTQTEWMVLSSCHPMMGQQRSMLHIWGIWHPDTSKTVWEGMSTLIEQIKIRGVMRSNFMFQLWLTATDWFKSSQH